MVNFWNTDRFKNLWVTSEFMFKHMEKNFQKHLTDTEAQVTWKHKPQNPHPDTT